MGQELVAADGEAGRVFAAGVVRFALCGVDLREQAMSRAGLPGSNRFFENLQRAAGVGFRRVILLTVIEEITEIEFAIGDGRLFDAAMFVNRQRLAESCLGAIPIVPIELYGGDANQDGGRAGMRW